MKITVSVRTNKVGSNSEREFEVEDEDWNSATEEEREEWCRDVMFDMIEWNYTTE